MILDGFKNCVYTIGNSVESLFEKTFPEAHREAVSDLNDFLIKSKENQTLARVFAVSFAALCGVCGAATVGPITGAVVLTEVALYSDMRIDDLSSSIAKQRATVKRVYQNACDLIRGYMR